jgi:hypothetical protein
MDQGSLGLISSMSQLDEDGILSLNRSKVGDVTSSDAVMTDETRWMGDVAVKPLGLFFLVRLGEKREAAAEVILTTRRMLLLLINTLETRRIKSLWRQLLI